MHSCLFADEPKLNPRRVSPIKVPDRVAPHRWEFDEDEDDSTKYALSKPQRLLIAKEQATNRSERNEQILRKRDKIPERLQRLIDDVILLAEGPFLSSERWERGLVERKGEKPAGRQLYEQVRDMNPSEELSDSEPVPDSEFDTYTSPYEGPRDLWEEILEISPRRNVGPEDSGQLSGREAQSDEVTLGYELGRLVQTLHQPNEQGTSEYADIIWGFIVAFIGEKVGRSDRDNFETLISELREWYSTREYQHSQHNRVEQYTETMTEDSAERGLKEGIEEAGITAVPTVCGEVRYQLHPARSQYLPDEVDSYTTKEQSDYEPKRVEEVTQRLVDLTPLREVEELADAVRNDVEIAKRGVPGIDSAKPALELIRDEEADTSDCIGFKLDKDAGQVTQMLNNLTEGGETDMRTNHPIVHKSQGNRGVRWELGTYGMLVVHCVIDREEDTDWLYRYALGPEDLSLKERKLITDSLDYLELI